MSGNTAQLGESSIFEALEAYPWHEDAEFQSGLSSILSTPDGSPATSEFENLIVRAKCFYFSRKANTHVDVDSYKAWKVKQMSSSSSASSMSHDRAVGDGDPLDISVNGPSTMENATADGPDIQEAAPEPGYPASFDDIIELIKSGKPVPGIKEIPNTVLSGQGTEARQDRRLKPWEKASETSSESQIH